MSGFSAEWLALREPIDHAARSEEIVSAVAYYFGNDDNIKITDIGSGTGSTIRALKPVLNNALSWHLIDQDESLMEVAKREAGSDAVEFSIADLSQSLDVVFENTPSLVSASALLDLVSEDWLVNFVSEVTARDTPFYAALTYDGRAGCAPALPMDETVINAFNQHQKNDKGFGPALGPAAAETAIRLFKEAGYMVLNGRSDWQGNLDHKAFQVMLLEGWKTAATEIEPKKSEVFQSWFDARKNLIENSDASLFVGHEDFLAVPV